jgi:hypothetical protein
VPHSSASSIEPVRFDARQQPDHGEPVSQMRAGGEIATELLAGLATRAIAGEIPRGNDESGVASWGRGQILVATKGEGVVRSSKAGTVEGTRQWVADKTLSERWVMLPRT